MPPFYRGPSLTWQRRRSFACTNCELQRIFAAIRAFRSLPAAADHASMGANSEGPDNVWKTISVVQAARVPGSA